ncbi:MAG: SHOCT domain-containing protein [Actinomycetota bacterium]
MVSFWDLVLLFFVFIPAAILWFRVVVDIFDRRDLSGVAKVIWLICVLILPLLGALVYIVTRPETEQDRERAAAFEQAVTRQQTTTGYSIADEIEKLDGLRAKGLLTEDEFNRQRTRLLA